MKAEWEACIRPVTVQQVQSDNKDVNQLQNNIINALQPLGQAIIDLKASVNNRIFSNHQIIKNVALTTTPKKIATTIGNIPNGFIITDINAAASVYRTAWDINSITLAASASCTVTILVF